MAILGRDIIGCATLNRAHMPRSIGRIEHRSHWCRRRGRIGLVLFIRPLDQARRFMDRAYPLVIDRRMYLKPNHMGHISVATLMAGHGLHHGRFAHNDNIALGQHALHRLNHRRRTSTANFLVKAKCDLKGARNISVMRLDQGPDRQCVKALHVTGAAAIVFAIFLNHFPRVRVPRLAINWHNISVPRQHNSALHIRANMGEQRRLVRLIRIGPNVRGDTVRGKIGLNPLDQRQVAVTADRRKGDQMGHQFKRG